VRALTEWSGVRDLSPGYFALVMATGILSTAADQDGAAMLSRALLVLTIVCYLVLLAATSWRLARYRAEFLADGTDPALAFTMFTFVAGSDVLGARLAGLGVWRHLVHRVPLRYEPGLGSLAFPLGMYCVASEALGRALRVRWLVSVGHAGTWAALAVWVVLFAAMLVSLAGVRLPSRSYSSTPT
jgi:tellurite resistance protein TehA-like permease